MLVTGGFYVGTFLTKWIMAALCYIILVILWVPETEKFGNQKYVLLIITLSTTLFI